MSKLAGRKALTLALFVNISKLIMPQTSSSAKSHIRPHFESVKIPNEQLVVF